MRRFVSMAMGATTRNRAPSASPSTNWTAVRGLCFSAAIPQSGHTVRPTFANSSRRKSLISVAVPTVDRALVTERLCWRAMLGSMPVMRSTGGRSIRSRN